MMAMHIYDGISLNSSWNEKRFRQKLQRKSKSTFHVQYLFLENRAFYEITLKNVAEPERTRMTV
jgi:Uri superfamily endonuclease